MEKKEWDEWFSKHCIIYGKELQISRLSADTVPATDPIQDMIDLRGSKKDIIVCEI